MLGNATLGRRIKVARVTAGLTQKELGEKLHPPRSIAAISYMETGKSRVFVVDLISISKITKISLVDYFLQDHGGTE